MMDFIYDLYQNDNFVLYLTIALVILVILFVVVLFFGKKDQKLEETKRLQKIELDNAFKEEKELPEKIEVEVKNDDVKKEEVPVNNEKKEEELPKKSIFDETTSIPLVKEESQDVKIAEPQNVEVTTFEPIIKEEKPKVEEKMVSLVEEDDKPLFMSNNDIDDIGKDLSELEKLKEEFRSMDLPKEEESKPIFSDEDVIPSRLDRKVEEKEIPSRLNNKNEEKKYKPSAVFSSVFVNNKDEQKEAEEVKPEVKEEPKKVSLFTIEDDDLELPTLKKDEKKEVNNIDNITGETYNINH